MTINNKDHNDKDSIAKILFHENLVNCGKK